MAAPDTDATLGVATTPRRGVALTPMETRRDVIVRAARLADALGYEAFSVAEGWGFDSTLVLTESALSTRRIVACSGVLSVWGRTPATLAMTAATLHRLSGGRSVLGLGASTRTLVEGFHDVCFAHPADKLREVTIQVRALLAGERALLDATRGSRPLRLGQPAAPDVPIWLAAMGARTVRVAAELADGWFPLFVARDQVVDRVHTLRKDRETPVSGPSHSPSSPAR
jgi:alkanesulfonate monooxygenase SsuD/methylene tetrahydromethanopterin reductase-like flavin-dependent oxidoreductase (luciferase family)